MRVTTRKETIVSLAMIATLLLAGFGCDLTPSPDDREGITDGIREPNGVTVTPPTDGDEAAASPTEGDIAAKPLVWIVGNPTGSFAHVQPGVKSEIYIDFETGDGDADLYGSDPNSPGPLVSIGMKGPGVIGQPVETQPFQPNTKMHFVFPINRFGEYAATGDVLDNGHSVFHFEVPEDIK